MDLSELLILLHYEVQKSYDFVHAITRSEGDKNTSVLHIALEQVEIELPVSLEERDAVFEPKKFKGLPIAVKMLNVPYSAKSTSEKIEIPKKELKGKAIAVKIVGPIEKVDKRFVKENLGRIKVVLKPILK
jgi:hypothetical protein